MSREQDRAPLSTEISPLETKVDPPALGRRHSVSPDDKPVRAPSDGLAIGQRLSGRYRIERELGVGGMGVVYLATDEEVVGEVFAIKVLKEDLHPEALDLLREEVHKTRRLSHPNIVDMHSVNVDGTRLYVLMEYLEGKSLNALLDEEFCRGMPLSHAWPIIEDTGTALGYAHDHNVIHSDLKPANIFLTTSGRTKLLDFGIARVSRGPLLTKRSGPLVLTPAYASCEMLEGREADPRDDIYSFACVIYEMLCGKRPFSGLTALEARERGAQIPPLEVLSREQNAALAQALAFEREARTASVERLLAGLAVKAPRGHQNAVLGAAIIATVAALGFTYLALDKFWISKRSVVVQSVAPAAQQAAISPKSIAVLPLLDLSTGHEQQYFADGLTEALIDRLTLFPGLSVTGQTSSFAVKDSKEDAPTLARRLRVEYLLEGTVRGSTEQLRVSTRLIRAADGFELWSQIFDRSGGQILKLEEEIARAVAADLRGSLIDTPAPAAPSTRSLEAYRLVLQADHVWRQQGFATDDERALLEAALQKDPGYADAWVELGGWWYDSMLIGKVVPETAVPSARAAYDRALALDKNSSRIYLGLAWLQMSQLDWVGAQRSIARADTLDPANLRLLTTRGELARSAGRWAEAIRLEHERLQRDPLSVGTKFVLAQSLLCGGEYANAEKIVRQMIAENPGYPGAQALLARVLAARGDAAAALKVVALEPDESARLAGLASVQSDLGRRDASDEAITQLRTRYAQTLPGLAGLAYAYRNQLAPAFQWLQRAVEQRQPEFAASLACTPEPAFGPLHADPRFAALRSSLGFDR